MLFTDFRKQYILFYIFISLTILLRCYTESTNYCSPDSKYYLEVANNIKNGLGPVGPEVFGYDSTQKSLIPYYTKTKFGDPDSYTKTYFAVWPLAYPVSIVGISYITHINVLWASKIFNIVLLGITFLLLYHLFGSNAGSGIFYFGSFTMIEISSYTWSENLVIPLFLLFIMAIKQIHESKTFSWIPVFTFSFALLAMCVTRYASFIYFLVGAFIMVTYLIKKNTLQAKSLFYGLSLSAIGFLSYLYINFYHTGYLTGMPRVDTQEYSYAQLFTMFYMGIFNQLHMIKQFRYNGNSDFALYLLFTAMQVVLIGYIVYVFKKAQLPFKFDQISKLLILNGFFYLIFITYMTSHSTIDAFDYRTLMPFSFPVMIAVLYVIEKKLRESHQESVILLIKVFFILSVLMNLPKHYLLSLL